MDLVEYVCIAWLDMFLCMFSEFSDWMSAPHEAEEAPIGRGSLALIAERSCLAPYHLYLYPLSGQLCTCGYHGILRLWLEATEAI